MGYRNTIFNYIKLLTKKFPFVNLKNYPPAVGYGMVWVMFFSMVRFVVDITQERKDHLP
jgi:hypothetical protein